MITIRRAQMKVFEKTALRNFAGRAVEHLETYFPDQCAAMGKEAVLDAVRFGMGRAAHHHFETERDILRYLTLMFTFGKDFDRDPEIPWARAILTNGASARKRTDALQTKARNCRTLGKGYNKPIASQTEEAGA